MRKRLALVIRLFNEAGKAVHAMPLLLFQPFFVSNMQRELNSSDTLLYILTIYSILFFLQTFIALGFSLACWIAVLVLIESSGTPALDNKNGDNRCTFKKDSFTLVFISLHILHINSPNSVKYVKLCYVKFNYFHYFSFQDGGIYL